MTTVPPTENQKGSDVADEALREMMEEVIELESDLRKNKELMSPLVKARRDINKRKRQLLADLASEHEARGVDEVTYKGYAFGVNKKPRLTLKKDDVLQALGAAKDAYVRSHTQEIVKPYIKQVGEA